MINMLAILPSMLKSCAILFVDCQSTGASPMSSSLLEIACNERSWVIKQDEEIPLKILRLVGITTEEIKKGYCSIDVFAELSGMLLQMQTDFGTNVIAVAHFSRIEQIYLDRLWLANTGAKFPLTVICTHKLTKLLYPRLPNYGLRALAGYFGMPLDQGKRALNHVNATKQIWEALVIELEKNGVNSLDQLTDFLDRKPARTAGRRDFLIPREKRLGLPQSPGVYRYLDRTGRILYVGKATSLKSRVNSYFTGGCRGDHRKLEMLAQAVDVEVTPTMTPLHAGLTEYDEIRRLKPPYNIAFKGQGRDPLKPLSLFMGTQDSFNPSPYVQIIKENFHELSDVDTLKDGIKLWRTQSLIGPDHFITERDLLNFGLPLLKTWIAEEKEKHLNQFQDIEENHSEETATDDTLVREKQDGEEEDVCWTPELVAHHCNRLVRRAVRHFIRSKWLLRLSRATIEVQLTDQTVKKRQKKSNPFKIPPSSSGDQFDARRVRVLLHELRRAESKGGSWVVTHPWPMTVPFWV